MIPSFYTFRGMISPANLSKADILGEAAYIHPALQSRPTTPCQSLEFSLIPVHGSEFLD